MAYWDAYISDDSDSDTTSEHSSTSSLEDEDEVNARCTPNWDLHRSHLLCHGFHLDTVKDVKQFYERYWSSGGMKKQPVAEYSRACSSDDEDALCKDPGLVGTPSSPFFCNMLMCMTLARQPLSRTSTVGRDKDRSESRPYSKPRTRYNTVVVYFPLTRRPHEPLHTSVYLARLVVSSLPY